MKLHLTKSVKVFEQHNLGLAFVHLFSRDFLGKVLAQIAQRFLHFHWHLEPSIKMFIYTNLLIPLIDKGAELM